MSRFHHVAVLLASVFCANMAPCDDVAFDSEGGDWVQLSAEFADDISASQLIEGLQKGLSLVELKKGYRSPIGAEERAKIVKSVTARHGYIWVPRKLSTVIGRLEEVLGYAKKGLDAAEDAFNVGKILGIAVGAKSLDEAVDLFAEEGLYQSSGLGEAAYWIATIGFGLSHGKSLTDSIVDGYDEKNIGKWTKLGFAGGEWFANFVNNLPWKKAERDAADRAFVESLKRQGINKEGLSVVEKWLALDVQDRVRYPIKVQRSWFETSGGGAATVGDSDGEQVCKPGDDPDASESVGDVAKKNGEDEDESKKAADDSSNMVCKPGDDPFAEEPESSKEEKSKIVAPLSGKAKGDGKSRSVHRAGGSGGGNTSSKLW